MSFSIVQSAYKSHNKTNMINYYVFIDDSVKPKGVVQIVHGMCEHMQRYEEFAKFLTKNGYIVCGNDHLGHGNSISNKSDLGYFGANSINNLVEDVHTLTNTIKEYRDLPIILMGHSMGSFITRCYLEKYSNEIDGCILSGTSGGYKSLQLGIKTIKFLINTKGEKYRSKMIKKLADSKTAAKFTPSFNREFDWLTRDKDVIERYVKDSKCNFTFTLNGYYTLFSLIDKITRDDYGKNINRNLPILIFSGDKDPVGDFSKGVIKAYNKYKDLQMKDVSLKLYKDGRHEMLNELNKLEVYDDILSWMNIRI